jgi:hypothetical protein
MSQQSNQISENRSKSVGVITSSVATHSRSSSRSRSASISLGSDCGFDFAENPADNEQNWSNLPPVPVIAYHPSFPGLALEISPEVLPSDSENYDSDDLNDCLDKEAFAIDAKSLLFETGQSIEPHFPEIFLGPINCALDYAWLMKNNITHIVCAAGELIEKPQDWSEEQCKQFNYLYLEVEDEEDVDIAQQFDRVHQFIDKVVKKINNEPSKKGTKLTGKTRHNANKKKRQQKNSSNSSSNNTTTSNPTAEFISSNSKNPTEILSTARPVGNILVHCFAGVSRSSTLVISYLMREKNLSVDEALAAVRQCRPFADPNKGFIKQLRNYELQLSQQRTGSNKNNSDKSDNNINTIKNNSSHSSNFITINEMSRATTGNSCDSQHSGGATIVSSHSAVSIASTNIESDNEDNSNININNATNTIKSNNAQASTLRSSNVQ